MMVSTASTAGTSQRPRPIPVGRPTREERYRARRARAARLVTAGLWLTVPALVALIVGLALPLFVGAIRMEVLGAGSALLLAAGALLLCGRREMQRARRASLERRLHAVRVDRGGTR